jgi:IS5 family transposase
MSKQLTFASYEASRNRKKTRAEKQLDKINHFVDWDKVRQLVKKTDFTGKQGGRKPMDQMQKVKMMFIQYLYNLSDPELEDQMHDRLSFQRFAGIDLSESIPDFTTLWRFRERLISLNLCDQLFELILETLKQKGLILKKGTSVDATILESTTKPLSKQKREELAQNPSPQIDTDADSTEKRGKKYFGYKGHIGQDVGSGLIRKRSFTSARPHDSQQMDQLLSGDEQAVFGDSAYSNKADKQKARTDGIYYGVLDKGTRRKKLSASQKKRNHKKSKIRCKVEHPFAYMKEKLDYKMAVAKNLLRNAFRFDMNCIIYNIMRANVLLTRTG